MSCLLPIRNSYAQYNACYCTSAWFPNATFGNACIANTDCWACAPGAYNTSWQSAFCSGYQPPPPVVTCTTTFAEKTEACPANHSGIKRYKQETKTCSDGQVTNYGWLLYVNTCVQNPPTCQTSSQTQTLSCQTGYTGSITQTQTSTCPDPYGSPVWSAWATTSNTCVKSLSNPTSPTSPVSPVNPASPVNQTATAVTMPNAIPGVPAANASMDVTGSATAMGSSPASTTNDSPQASTETSSAQSQEKSATKESAPTSASGTSTTPKASPSTSQGVKGRLNIGGLGQALSLELFVKPGITQPNVFPEVSINQSVPAAVRHHHDFLMELLNQPLSDQSDKLRRIARDTVEYEQ